MAARRQDSGRPLRAISIRQPYVELILRGIKKKEYRSRATTIRGPVYIYAAKRPAEDGHAWRTVRRRASELPSGVIVGKVEIVDCRLDKRNGYAYVLQNPRRLPSFLRARNQPMPCWWHPRF